MDTGLLQRLLNLLGNSGDPPVFGVRPVGPGLHLDTVTLSEHKVRVDYTEYVQDWLPLPVANTWDSFITTAPLRRTEYYDLNSLADCKKLERLVAHAEDLRRGDFSGPVGTTAL